MLLAGRGRSYYFNRCLSGKALDFQSDYSLRYLQIDVTWQDGTGAKTYTLKSLRMAPENE